MSFALRSTPLLIALLVGLSAIAAGSSAHAAQPTVQYGPVPAWVEPQPAYQSAELSAQGNANNGRRVLLLDNQTRATAQGREDFEHYAFMITSSEGLKSYAQLVINFDAELEKITFHHVRIHREGKVINRLEPSEVQILRREERLEDNILNGHRSAVFIVKDLRVGDILEYAYTRKDLYPNDSGHFSQVTNLGYSEPTLRFFDRIIVSPKRPLRFHPHESVPGNAPPQPLIQERDGAVEYRWENIPLSAYKSEPSTPSWYSEVPWVQISDYASWGEVATWAKKQFSVDPGPKIRPLASQWKQESSKSEQLLLKAIRFTQDEIRYLGLEIGSAKWRPASPSVVLDRRYGDCKDKAVFLVALLKELGIRATPVLVNSAEGKRLNSWLPSPSAFDHAIVRVEVQAGNVYWVDPTLTNQGGELSELLESDLGWALPLDENRTDLEQIRPYGRSQNQVHIKENIRLPDADASSGQEASIEVEYVYSSIAANVMRSSISTNTQQELGKHYLEAYQKNYEDLRESAPIEISDSRDSNTIRIVGHYVASGLWKKQNERSEANIRPRILGSILELPNLNDRKAPLAWAYPHNLDYQIKLELSSDYNIEQDSESAQGPAFEYSYSAVPQPQGVLLHWTYTALADSVSAEKFEAHREAIQKAQNSLGYLLYAGPPQKDPNWITTAIVALSTLVGVGLSLLAFRPKPQAPSPEPQRALVFDDARGSFVLFVVAMRLLTGPFVRIGTLREGKWIYSKAQWASVYASTDAESGGPLVAVAAVAESAIEAAVLPVTVAALVLFFMRKRAFRNLYPGLEYVLAAYLLTEGVFAVTVQGKPEGLLGGLFSAVIGFALAQWVRTSARSSLRFSRP